MKGARDIWSGMISFGLVNIPVRLYSPTAREQLDLDYLHKTDFAPIHYTKTCSVDGQEVPFKDVVRGYKLGKDSYVIVTDQDLKRASPRKTNSIDISDFVDEMEIDPVYFEKPYYLEPERSAYKSYALLCEALRETEKVGIAKFVLRNREHLAAVRPDGEVLVLEQLRFQNEVRLPRRPEDMPRPKLSRKELDMAVQLINQLTSEFTPSAYKDTYIEEVRRVIEEKAKGKVRRPKGAEKAPGPTRTPDLMAKLRASIAAGRRKVS